MPDIAAVRHHPLARQLESVAHSAGASVSLSALPAETRFILRGDGAVATAISAAFGVSVRSEPMQAAQEGSRAALWLGPDEWLLLASESDTATLIATLTSALSGMSGCLVDISHRQTAIEISGPRAEDVLNVHVPLDLSETAFPVQMSTRTLLAKAEVVLWRQSSDTFRIEVTRSMAPYVWDMLGEAMLEYEIA